MSRTYGIWIALFGVMLRPRADFLPQLLSLILALQWLFMSPVFAGTNVSTGNGEEVVLASKGKVSVRFVDMVSDAELPTQPSQVLDSQQVAKHFYPDSTVKKAADPIENFYSCALGVLKPYAERYPAIQTILERAPAVRAYQVEFFLSYNALPTDAIRNQIDPMTAEPSERLLQQWQQPLAIYANNQLWVSKLSALLSPEDRCALQVHESFRLLNNAAILASPLTTPEIEALTRHFMDAPPTARDLTILSGALDKLAHGLSESAISDQLHEIQERIEMLEQLYGASCGKPQTHAKGYERAFQQIIRLRGQYVELNTNLVGATLGRPNIQDNVKHGIQGQSFGTVAEDQLLTHPLGLSRCWNVFTMQQIQCN